MTEYGAIKELSIEYPGEYHKQREAKDIAIRGDQRKLRVSKARNLGRASGSKGIKTGWKEGDFYA